MSTLLLLGVGDNVEVAAAPPPTGTAILVGIYIGPVAPGTVSAWTNMPSALTEFLGAVTRRWKIDLTGQTQWHLGLELVALGVAGAKIGMQYSLDNGTTWKGLDNGTAGSNSTGGVIDLTVAEKKNSGWLTIIAEARATVLIRVAGNGGNGVADPSFRNMDLNFKP